MRKAASRSFRVKPGDRVEIYAQLPSKLDLARLHVFARCPGELFSPYVLNASVIANAVGSDLKPLQAMPVMLRLTDLHPRKVIRFVADIDGYIKVLQEVDLAYDPTARVKIVRNPHLPWYRRAAQSIHRLIA